MSGGAALAIPEGWGWWALRRPAPEMDGRPAADLLARGASLPGTRRLVRGGAGVEVLCEARAFTAEEAGRRLEAAIGPGTAAPPEDEIEAALASIGLAWSRRGQGWVVPPREGVAVETLVAAAPGGARVETVLAEWEGELDEAASRALPEFLLAVQGGLRAVRAEITGGRALLVSWADGAALERELRGALEAAAAGAALLGREARALLDPPLARAYLEAVPGAGPFGSPTP